jgi:hypothetical protein
VSAHSLGSMSFADFLLSCSFLSSDGTFVYFLCTRVAPSALFIEFLFIKKKKARLFRKELSIELDNVDTNLCLI